MTRLRHLACALLVACLSIVGLAVTFPAPASAALANINNTWTYASVGKCRYSMKQPFTNVVQIRIDDADCYKIRAQGWVENNQNWQCRYPGGASSWQWKVWPKQGEVYSCSVWNVRGGATNVNLCYVEVQIYDVNEFFGDGLYIRGGRIM